MGNNVNYCQCKCRNADNEEECSFDKAGQEERECKENENENENDTQKGGGTCSAIGNESNYLSGVNSGNQIIFKKHNCTINAQSIISNKQYECNNDIKEDNKYIINKDKEMNSLQLHLNYLPHSLYYTTILTNWKPCIDIQPILDKYNIIPITPHILNAQPSNRSHYYLSSSSQISSSSSPHNKDPFQLDKVVLYSEMKKIHTTNSNFKSQHNRKYILRFCTITSTEFAYYQTKEKFITLQNPVQHSSLHF